MIDREEVARLLRELGISMTRDKLEYAMHQMDPNGDNEISFEEFEAWYDKQEVRAHPSLRPGRVSPTLRLPRCLLGPILGTDPGLARENGGRVTRAQQLAVTDRLIVLTTVMVDDGGYSSTV